MSFLNTEHHKQNSNHTSVCFFEESKKCVEWSFTDAKMFLKMLWRSFVPTTVKCLDDNVIFACFLKYGLYFWRNLKSSDQILPQKFSVNNKTVSVFLWPERQNSYSLKKKSLQTHEHLLNKVKSRTRRVAQRLAVTLIDIAHLLWLTPTHGNWIQRPTQAQNNGHLWGALGEKAAQMIIK